MQVGDIVQIKSGLSITLNGEIVAEFKRRLNNESFSQHEYSDGTRYWVVKLENGNEVLAPENFLEINNQLDSLNPVGP